MDRIQKLIEEMNKPKKPRKKTLNEIFYVKKPKKNCSCKKKK